MTTARRRAMIPVAILALGLAVSACSGSAGDAALVGNNHVTEASLNSNVNEVLVAQGFSENKSDPELVKNILNWYNE